MLSRFGKLTAVLLVGAPLLSIAAPTASQASNDNSTNEKPLGHIPHYVLKYAPYVHLYSGENFWPGDIKEHLEHTTPHGNYTPLIPDYHATVDNLADLNEYDTGRTVFLKSDDDPESHPDWLGGAHNIPKDGRSTAPAINIVVQKPHGIVDAFWFFFYSFNLGNTVLNVRFGNHVGDWEHTLVRFQHGKPIGVFLSQHSGGDAYTYAAIDKIGKRPLVFSATGTHAMYSTPGVHAYAIPLGLLHDVTDRGPLWDPSLNFHSYTYNVTNREFRVGDASPKSPLSWINFNGRWGDKIYPLSDRRQYGYRGLYHYVDGPSSCKFKNLDRNKICQSKGVCNVHNWLPPLFELKDGNITVSEEQASHRSDNFQSIIEQSKSKDLTREKPEVEEEAGIQKSRIEL